MKRLSTYLSSFVALAAITPISFVAHANEDAPPSEENTRNLEFVVAAGLTFGGDDLFTVEFTDGESETLEAGGLIDLKAGLSYRFSDAPVSLQTTIGYHFDNVSADNGDASFSRFPIDFLAFYHINQHRIGVGPTLHTGTELDIDFDASVLGLGSAKGTIDFDDATGFVIEYGYRFKDSPATLALRAVQIDYNVSSGNGTDIDGNHIGFYGYLNF